jgi:hypothetical protein
VTPVIRDSTVQRALSSAYRLYSVWRGHAFIESAVLSMHDHDDSRNPCEMLLLILRGQDSMLRNCI